MSKVDATWSPDPDDSHPPTVTAEPDATWPEQAPSDESPWQASHPDGAPLDGPPSAGAPIGHPPIDDLRGQSHDADLPSGSGDDDPWSASSSTLLRPDEWERPEWGDDPSLAADEPVEGFSLLADEPADPRPRRHLGRYVAVAAAALVVGAGVATGPTIWRVYAARHTTLNLPAEIAGLSRDTSGDSQDTENYLRDAVGTGTSLSDPVGAVYDVGGDTSHSVLLFGGTGSIFRPEHNLTTVLGLLDDSSDAITGLRDVPAGPLGGLMKCGISVGSDDGTGTDPDMPICGWADHGSVGAALFPGRTVDQAADLMRQFRAAVEKQ